MEWNGILESEILIINTRSNLGFHVLYCIGIKSVIASNNCANSDAGIYNMHLSCVMQLKVDVAALC